MIFIVYILIGILAGLLSGLLGLGGGIVIVPALAMIFTQHHFPSALLMQIVTATSLASIAMTSLMTTWLHHQYGLVKWKLTRYIIPSLMLGACIGVTVAKYLPAPILRGAFSLFAVAIGVKILLETRSVAASKKSTPRIWQLVLFSVFVGAFSGILGTGGGILIIPLLTWFGLSMPEISASSSACVFPMALMATFMAIVTGWNVSSLPPHTWGFVYWPAALAIGLASLVGAPVGAWLVRRLPIPLVKRIFAVVLFIIAWRMLSV